MPSWRRRCPGPAGSSPTSSKGFGPLPAFLFGWSELTVIRASALGAIATIFAEYLGYFIRLTPEQVRYVAAAAILLVGFAQLRGRRGTPR